jgi:tetratricopeptide (TPR) repeat protein
VQVPAGEHSILFDYSHPTDGWAVKNSPYTVTMDAEKMYLLSVLMDEKAGGGIVSRLINEATSFVRDEIVDIIPLIDMLPRANPKGVVYQINEIDQAAFDMNMLAMGSGKKSVGFVLGSIIVGILWLMIMMVGLRATFYLFFMGKFMNSHKVAATILCFALAITGVLLLNYNSGGLLSLYLLSTLLIGGGLSGWDFGGDHNKSGLEKLGKKDYDGAISDFNDAIKVAFFNAAYFINRGTAYFNKNDYDRAIVDYTEAVRLLKNSNGVFGKDNRITALESRGNAYFGKGNYDLALADYTESIKNSPQATAYNVRGTIYLNKKDYDHAIADYTEAIKLNPQFAIAYTNRGTVYLTFKNDYDLAIADFTQAISLNPNDADAHNGRGNAYRIKRDYDRAITDYTETIKLNPQFAAAYMNRGYVYLNFKKDCDLAIADFTQTVSLNPNDAGAYNYRGNAYLNKQDYDRAIADYTEAIKLNPKFAVAYYNRGTAYLNKKDYNLAIADFTQVISLNPNDADTYNYRGVAYCGVGSFDKAMAEFTEAIRLNPNNTTYKENLAYAQEQAAKEQ